jgi:hypothetical protein
MLSNNINELVASYTGKLQPRAAIDHHKKCFLSVFKFAECADHRQKLQNCWTSSLMTVELKGRSDRSPKST